MIENHKCMELARNWLINSKIHNIEKADSGTFGSFNNFYDLRRKTCPYAYTEITAYAIELLLDLYERTKEPRYLENTEFAGDWICNMQYLGQDKNAYGSFSWNFPLPRGPKSSKAYSFDTGICVGALVELYKKRKKQIYLDTAIKGADWLISVMQNPDGSIKPSYDWNAKSFLHTIRKGYLPECINIRLNWYRRVGCHHGKVAIGLLKLHSLTKDQELEDAAEKLCEWTLTQQDLHGYFIVNPQSTSVFTHTHCYATEGLLYAYEFFEDKRFLSAVEKATSWLVKIQNLYRSFPDWIHDRKSSYTTNSSSLAQTVRILEILQDLKGDKNLAGTITKIKKKLLKMQCINTKDPNALGGFYLSEIDLKMIKYKLPRLYSWPTMFAVHAFLLAEDNQVSRPIDLW